MGINKAVRDNATDGGSSIPEDQTLTGPNTELLSVRVSKGLYRELERIAKKSKRQLPELLREMLWFHAFPSNLQSRLQEIKGREAQLPDEPEVGFYLTLSPQLAMYQHQADKILESCEVVRGIEKQALDLKTKLARLEEEANTAWQVFLDSAGS